MPGLTTAAQYSGSPLPLPMRVSAGMAVTDLCGKTRMYRRPSPRTEWVAVMRPASMASALSQPPSIACRPKSPWLTVLPRQALPRTRPRWVLRYFTRFGISGMFVLLVLYSPPRDRKGAASQLLSHGGGLAVRFYFTHVVLPGRGCGPVLGRLRRFLREQDNRHC